VGIYHYDYRPHDAADYGFLRDAVRGLGQDLARSGGSTGTSRL
jgi:hypothetical protein